MIHRRTREGLLVIRQTDHALASGTFARHWGGAADRPAPFEPVVLAAACHDEGWREWEEAPEVDPRTHRPYQFFQMRRQTHTHLYRRGIARVAAMDPYAGLLVSMHGSGLYTGRFGLQPELLDRTTAPAEQPVVQAFLAEQAALQGRLQQELADRHGPDFEERLWYNYKLLQVWDRMSLFFCLHDLATGAEGSPGPAPLSFGGPPVTFRLRGLGPGQAAVDPYPFSETPLRFTLPARLVPDRDYADDADFRREFAAAVPFAVACQLVPWA